MNKNQSLGLIAIAAFAVSYFLPAYDENRGFACFAECWDVLFGHNGDILSGMWFYYSGFVISNILFVVLVVALFLTKKHRRFTSVLSVLFFLHILSWLVLHVFPSPSQIAELKVGYYVWLVAYGLLAAAHLRKESTESPGLIDVAHSGA